MVANYLVSGERFVWDDTYQVWVPDQPDWIKIHYTWMLPWLDVLQKHLLALGCWDRSLIASAWRGLSMSGRINVCAGCFERSVSFACVICARSAEHNVMAIAIFSSG
jgi:hypothetical protein